MSANWKTRVSPGNDFVIVQTSRAYGQPEVPVLSISGATGKIALGQFSSSTLLQDTWDKLTADGSAGAATVEHLIFQAPGPLVIKSVAFIPDAALTASDSNYATITISVRNADGTNQQTVASQTTKITGGSGNWTQWVAVPLVITQAFAALTKGQLLTIAITKTGTGVIVPWGSFAITYVLN